MKKDFDVIALGELLIDFAPQSVNEAGYPVLSANPGGAPGNYLAALAKYGSETAMIGKVGDDAFGRLLVKTLEDAGIGTKGILMDPEVHAAMLAMRAFMFERVYQNPVVKSEESKAESLVKTLKSL